MTAIPPARPTSVFAHPLFWVVSLLVVAGAGAGIWAMLASAAREPAGTTTVAAATGGGGPVLSGVLPDETRMGAVAITARDLPAMRAFYADAVGLAVLEESPTTLSLGADGEELVRVIHDSVASPAAAEEAGLYHSAILFPDEASLAAALAGVAGAAPELYQGAADHGVSRAFYFGDPEGNGVELYVDRPEDEWEWNSDGSVVMGSAALDPNAFLQQHLGDAAPLPAVIGHVHLKVGSVDEARAFYVDVLGFDVTSAVEGALFMSAGGYHHHLAANVWQSAGAGVRAPALGLAYLDIVVPGDAEVGEAAGRLADAGLGFTTDAGSLTVDDPWGNTVHIRSESAEGSPTL